MTKIEKLHFIRACIIVVCALLGTAKVYSQSLWKDNFYGMTKDNFLLKNPHAKEVSRRHDGVNMRIIDSMFADAPAEITFIFDGATLSQVDYRQDVEGPAKSALAQWDLVLSEFREWYRPLFIEKSKRIVGQVVNTNGEIRLDHGVLGEVAEIWESERRTVIRLELRKDMVSGGYEITGSVRLALWEKMAREKLASLSARDVRELKIKNFWRGRVIGDYVREFGPPDNVMKISAAETIYIWVGSSAKCKTTVFVGKANKILDRNITGCDW